MSDTILLKDLIGYKAEAIGRINECLTSAELEKLRVEYLGKNSPLKKSFLKNLGSITSVEERKLSGQQFNKTLELFEGAITKKAEALKLAEINARLDKEWVDITLPPRAQARGTIHPISRVLEEITAIFAAQGFAVAHGPEIEDDYYNFTALNFPENHPARQMHDTFFLRGSEHSSPPLCSPFERVVGAKAPPHIHETGKVLLRTHTSPVQVRTMQSGKPPFRFIAPGKTFRHDSDLTHTPMFHQVEGLVIDKNINMGHLKGCIESFLRAFFELDNVPVRFRPSFFPFTEPSAEVDIGCQRDRNEIKIGAGKDWLEVMGCGMVHPNVLKNCNINPDEWQGFAFGMGVERLAMLKYGIPDLRTFFESDIRWLKHYGFSPLGDAA